MNLEPQNFSPDSPPSALPSVPIADTPHPNAVNGHNGSQMDNPPGDSTPGGAPSPPETQNQNLKIDHPERRSHSKIGRLPKATRDKLNEMVRDGVPFPDIPLRLGDGAKDITARNISSWHSGPHYQRWVLEQDWLEKLRDDQESAFDLLTDFDASKFDEATLQLAITRLFMALRHIDSGDLNQKLGGNVQSFARLVSALARACRETTNIEKYRAASAKAVAPPLKDPSRKLSQRERRAIVHQVDEILGISDDDGDDDDLLSEADARRASDSSPAKPNASSAPFNGVLP